MFHLVHGHCSGQGYCFTKELILNVTLLNGLGFCYFATAHSV